MKMLSKFQILLLAANILFLVVISISFFYIISLDSGMEQSKYQIVVQRVEDVPSEIEVDMYCDEDSERTCLALLDIDQKESDLVPNRFAIVQYFPTNLDSNQYDIRIHYSDNPDPIDGFCNSIENSDRGVPFFEQGPIACDKLLMR